MMIDDELGEWDPVPVIVFGFAFVFIIKFSI